jgi:carbohydrate-binding DOMON domain-containing protein
MRTLHAIALAVLPALCGCVTTSPTATAAKGAYHRLGTSTVHSVEVVTTSEDGRTQTKETTTETYESPAAGLLKSAAGITTKK